MAMKSPQAGAMPLSAAWRSCVPVRTVSTTPLPLYHANSGVLSLFGAILTGNCQIQAERFHPKRWWREIAETKATVVHYLGIIAAMLHSQPTDAYERSHTVRFGLGAGVEPQLHRAIERRFGFPPDRSLGDDGDGARPGGLPRASPGRHARVRAGDPRGGSSRDRRSGARCPPTDSPASCCFRHSEATPRRGCFSGYLNDDAATEQAWRGGWFHTGDVVLRDPDGMLHFVDRKKNIIRRSGENIAAAEVEAVFIDPTRMSSKPP